MAIAVLELLSIAIDQRFLSSDWTPIIDFAISAVNFFSDREGQSKVLD
jgi:hypothetical protein